MNSRGVEMFAASFFFFFYCLVYIEKDKEERPFLTFITPPCVKA